MSWSFYDDPTVCREGFVLLGSVVDASPATVRRAVQRDGLIQALPSAYVLPERQDDLAVWLRLVCRCYPNAVISGRAAWEAGTQRGPELAWPRGERTIAVCDRLNRPDRRPFRFLKRRVDPEFVVQRDGISRVSPAHAAAELLTFDDAATACDFLRLTRARPAGVGMERLRDAVGSMAHVPGQADRRRLMAELEVAPWSLLELHLHRLLRAEGITGWGANLPVRLGPRTYLVDVAFPEVRVAVEADGRLHHSASEDFERDRERWNHLAAGGWIVIRVTWASVHESPQLVIAQIRAALASRA